MLRMLEEKLKNIKLKNIAEKKIITVGTLVLLKMPFGENEKNTPGVCYNKYTIGKHVGYSIIFQDGDYCGFGVRKETKEWLEVIGYCELKYEFTNVIQLTRDYEEGYFDTAFAKATIIE